jgi:ABC-2 type transport system permease protein
MKILLRQIKLEIKLYLRGRQALFLTLAFPVIMILIFGAVFGSQSWSGIPAIDYLLPGIIGMALMMACMTNNAVSITTDRDKGIYRRLSLTPLKRRTLLTGHIIVRYLVALVSTVLLMVIGIAAFKAHAGGNYFLFWLVLTLAALAFVTMGFVISTLSKNTQSAQALSMAVLFPIMFLGCCFWPLDIMPSFLRPICEALPTFRMNDALRMITVEGVGFNGIWQDLLVIIGWLVVCSIVAVKFFKWESSTN